MYIHPIDKCTDKTPTDEYKCILLSLYVLFPTFFIIIYLKFLYLSIKSIEKDIYINTDKSQDTIKKEDQNTNMIL